MLSPLPRRSSWAYCFAQSPSRVSLPRKGHRVGLRSVLFEACSAFTRVTACTLALSPIRDTHSEGFSYFVTSTAAPVASGWSSHPLERAALSRRTPNSDIAVHPVVTRQVIDTDPPVAHLCCGVDTTCCLRPSGYCERIAAFRTPLPERTGQQRKPWHPLFRSSKGSF